MKPLLMRWWWLGLVAFAGITLAAGAWLEHTVAKELEGQLASELATIRDLNTTALREWLRAVEHASEVTASDEETRRRATELAAQAMDARDASALATLEAQQHLRRRLAVELRVWELKEWLLVADHRVVGASADKLLGIAVPDSDLPEAALRGRTAIDLPHRPSVDAFDRRETLMWVVTPVRDEASRTRAYLALKLDTEKTFTRLLRTARFGETGETYAIDRDGLLLSSSRFERDLVASGALDAGERSALALSAREPSAGAARGALTRAASAAVEKRKGVDVSGYRDYRGIEVVGAWTWLDDYGFAVLTELDRAEAYRSTRVIRLASRGATVIIFFSALVIGATTTTIRRLQKRVERAERLGQYTLERKIGEGGCGVVYLARHALLRRPTAIKLLKSDVDDAVVARFEREVQTTALLAHPNTIAIYDYGRTENGTFYYAMELLEGASLEELIASNGPFPPSRAIHILLQLLGSLGEAHDRGLVHRDVKPANVMLSVRGGIADFVKVVDFGLVKEQRPDARLTQSNAILGTPQYMSPEALQEPESVDLRSDLYAVGAVAFFVLTGRHAIEGDNMMAIISKQLVEPPPRLEGVDGAPPALDALVQRLMAKSRDARPASAADVIAELEQIRDASDLRWSPREAQAWWHARGDSTARVQHGEPSVPPEALHIGLEARGS